MVFKIAEGIYLGLGYQFDSYFKIVDQKLRLNSGDSLITSHYAYNTNYGFDLKKYYSSAMGINLLVPIIGSNPATGFMFGVGGQYAFKMPQSKLSLELRARY